MPRKAGSGGAGSDGCEAATDQIQSGLAGLRCVPHQVQVAVDDLPCDTADSDAVPDDYIDEREEYEQLQSSYDARW